MSQTRVLVVDDHEAIRLTLRNIFNGRAFEVSGLTAVSVIRHKNPKAVPLLLSPFP